MDHPAKTYCGLEDLQFLAHLDYSRVLMEFEALEDVRLQPFPGPSLRGALGHHLKRALCPSTPTCSNACALPHTCPYTRLFSQDAPGASGMDLPRWLLLFPPAPRALELLALTGRVEPPLSLHPPRVPHGLSVVEQRSGGLVPAGRAVSLILTFIGLGRTLFHPILRALAGAPLDLSGRRLRLARVTCLYQKERELWNRSSGSSLDTEPSRQTLASALQHAASVHSGTLVRLAFLTPARKKLDNRYIFSPASIASSLVDSCLRRAVKAFNWCCAGPRSRLTDAIASAPPVRLTGHCLYHYALPRYSFRQERAMDFDGVIGYLDLAIDHPAAFALLKTAEILHFGQKASAGLGAVRVHPLWPGKKAFY